MTELFGRDRTAVGRHVRNVFADGELERIAMCKICTLPAPTSPSACSASMARYGPSPTPPIGQAHLSVPALAAFGLERLHRAPPWERVHAEWTGRAGTVLGCIFMTSPCGLVGTWLKQPRLDFGADRVAQAVRRPASRGPRTPRVACARRCATRMPLTSADFGPRNASRPHSFRCKALIFL